MCGICCLLVQNDGTEYTNLKHCMKYGQICHRGPNASLTKEVPVSDTHALTLQGHVLHLRGQLTPQPLEHQNGDLLLWNGEIFGGIQVEPCENDTEVLLELLTKDISCNHILSTMAAVQGPWSFIYWQKATQQLYFGRDMFGRRSLLWHLPKSVNDVFILSSVQLEDYNFEEVPSVGIFSLKINNNAVVMTMYPRDEAVWPGTDICVKSSDPRQICLHHSLPPNFRFEFEETQVVPMSIPKLNKDLTCETQVEDCHSEESCLCSCCLLSRNNSDRKKYRESQISAVENKNYTHSDDLLSEASNITMNLTNVSADDPKEFLQNILQADSMMNKLSDQLIDVLLKAVKLRVYNQVDLNTKMKPCDECKRHGRGKLEVLKKNVVKTSDEIGSIKKTPDEQSCEENTVIQTEGCETNGETKDKGLKPIDSYDTDSPVNSDLANIGSRSGEKTSEKHPVRDEETIEGCSEGSIPTEGTSTDTCREVIGHAKVAVLFSGGIDSAVITALVDRCLPENEPVDLVNVAFEQQINQQQKKKCERSQIEHIKWNVPDRLTGYTCLKELNPNRQWNFIKVDITVKELQETRFIHIQHLLYPLETVLDDSIGCAIWFAARGCGILGNTEQIGKPYKSTAKVILCGMGADEQLAGYSRHRGKFMDHGWQGLLDEVELDVNRISARNLGRDDRIITDHGKESRFPFLDESVVNFLQQLQIQYKANLSLPRGVGEKLLLRLCAVKLGLLQTATFPKRAIQFGSRIAKSENNKEKGSDKCNRLKSTQENN